MPRDPLSLGGIQDSRRLSCTSNRFEPGRIIGILWKIYCLYNVALHLPVECPYGLIILLSVAQVAVLLADDSRWRYDLSPVLPGSIDGLHPNGT